MKNKISRLMAIGALAIAIFATSQGQANFSGTTWGWPYPESGGYLAQGSVWNGSAPNYANGWSLARWLGSDPNNLTWCGVYSLNDDSDFVTIDNGSGQTHGGYRVVEYYWDGGTYDYGESNIDGYYWTNGGCD